MTASLRNAPSRSARTRGSKSTVAETIAQFEPLMLRSLSQWIAIPSVSGQEGPFTKAIAEWCKERGLTTDLWQADEQSLPEHVVLANRRIPLAGRPTLVASLPGNGGRSLIFNAHSDVVDAPGPERWTAGPWSGDIRRGWIYGRGACDVKGPLASAIWAILAVRELRPEGLAGDVLLELVPGEEDSVGVGTLTSIARGVRADACVVLEPTDGNPRCASRAGCRFRVTIAGRAVHGTMKWLGRDAIRTARLVLDSLDELEKRWNDRKADPLFASYPLARPITVDSVNGGDWQGMICDRCVVAGYLELLPSDDLQDWEQRFAKELSEAVRRRGGDSADIGIAFTERYPGHRTDPQSDFCRRVTHASRLKETWQAFNSGCEAGIRAGVHDTPTVVWGPGSLQYAHAVDERIRFAEVREVARQFVRLILDWCDGDRAIKAAKEFP